MYSFGSLCHGREVRAEEEIQSTDVISIFYWFVGSQSFLI